MKAMLTGLSLVFIGAIFFPSVILAGGLNVPENIKLDRIECGGTSKAYAFFSWNKVSFATSYRFYSRLPQDKYTSYDEISENGYKLGFNPQYEFYIAVSAINDPGPNVSGGQISESDLSKEFFLSVTDAFKKNEPFCIPSSEENSGQESQKEVPLTRVLSRNEKTGEQQPIPEFFRPTNQEAYRKVETKLVEKDQSEQLEQAQKRVEQLEEQMENIQQKLTETQRRQSALEQLVNKLLNILRNLFKF